MHMCWWTLKRAYEASPYTEVHVEREYTHACTLSCPRCVYATDQGTDRSEARLEQVMQQT